MFIDLVTCFEIPSTAPTLILSQPVSTPCVGYSRNGYTEMTFIHLI